MAVALGPPHSQPCLTGSCSVIVGQDGEVGGASCGPSRRPY